MSWTAYAAIFAAFFLTHSIPVRPAVKSRVVRRIGARGFALMYSVLSVTMLVLLIWAAGEAPYVQLWPQMPWHRHAGHLGMLAVCLILAFSIARPNPLSFGGARNDTYDPDRPGIMRWTRHPVLVALALWAGVHLLPNGDLAHVILFGVLSVFSLAGWALVDRRKRRDLGARRWAQLDEARRAAPWRPAPVSWWGAAARFLIGLVVYGALLWAHPHVIGVSAL